MKIEDVIALVEELRPSKATEFFDLLLANCGDNLRSIKVETFESGGLGLRDREDYFLVYPSRSSGDLIRITSIGTTFTVGTDSKYKFLVYYSKLYNKIYVVDGRGKKPTIKSKPTIPPV